VVEVNPSSAFESAPAGNPLLPMFTDTRMKVALAPSLDTGDAVEFEVLHRVRKWPKDGDFWLAHFPNRLMRRELISILGGEPAQLPALPTTTAHFTMVDSQAPSEAAAFVKSLSVTPIAWPGHELASLRTIELARAGDGWTVVRSYVGMPPE
jgi:hypothetical protein